MLDFFSSSLILVNKVQNYSDLASLQILDVIYRFYPTRIDNKYDDGIVKN